MRPIPAQPAPISAIDLATARQLAESAIRNHSAAGPFSAVAALEQWPGLWTHESIVIDLAYEEFCQRIEQGEEVELAEFARRFPAVEEPLQHQLVVHRLLANGLSGPPVTAEWPVAPGEFAHFQLVQPIGEGAAARVYLALDEQLDGRARILKVSPRIGMERQSLARLVHPSIVDALYCGTDDASGLDFLCLRLQGRWTLQHVMQFLAGRQPKLKRADELWALLDQLDDLPESVRSGERYSNRLGDPRSLDELLIGWAEQILQGLDYAHGKGFIHCDVKPSNILIAWNGDAVLLDLHAAQMLEARQHSASGTIPYMAPEQLLLLADPALARGTRLTKNIDLFAWAATFYEAILGEPAFHVPNSELSRDEFARAHRAARQAGLPQSSTTGEPLLRELISIIGPCFQFEAQDRPVAEQVLHRLRAVGHWRHKVDRTVRKYPASCLTAAVAAAAICVSLGAAAVDRWPTPRKDAERGLQALASGDLSEAFQHLDRAVRKAPKNHEARSGLVTALLLQKQFSAVNAHLDQLPDGPFVQRCRAYALIGSGGSVQEALEIYTALIASPDATPADYSNGAFCLRTQRHVQDWHRAEELAWRAVRAQPDLQEAWANLLVVKRRLAMRGEEACDLATVERAVRQVPRSLSVWSEAASSYATAGSAAEQAKLPLQSEELQSRTVAACLRAEQLGLGRDFLRLIMDAWPSLQSDKTLRNLAARLPNSRPTAECDYLVCPAHSSKATNSIASTTANQSGQLTGFLD
ncbi:MAG TPA: protein kinase [Planctomycetaceae bacterium]|nr:protein kinase [Planctomycetaceae bacterium]